MLDSDDDGEDGPGEATSSGVALGRDVLDSYVGEAAMGTARLLDIGVWDWGPCVGFTVAPLYWVAYGECQKHDSCWVTSEGISEPTYL